jgi:uracil-DNA glycosylase
MKLPQFEADPSCQACELHTTSPTVGMASTRFISVDSDQALLFVGRNPVPLEPLPFTSKAGLFMRGIEEGGHLKKAGAYIDPWQFRDVATLYGLYMVRCQKEAGDAPNAKETKACLFHFLDDVEKIAASHSRLTAVFLGSECLRYLYSFCLGSSTVPKLKDAISRAAEPLRLPNGVEISTFFTYHPAYVLRSFNKFYAVEDTLNLVDRHLRNESVGSVDSLRIVKPLFPHEDPTLRP